MLYKWQVIAATTVLPVVESINKLHMRSLITWQVILLLSFQELCGQIPQEGHSTDPHRQLAREIFCELVELNTTLNNGSTAAAEAMAERLRAAGFRDNDLKLVGPHPRHMNLVVRYRGKGALPPILFIGHLDVVEALRQDWSFDPFKFRETDGYFYGRGTLDMKSDDAVWLQSYPA
jgi:acetylornithine deacetylase/succinyl-diaminopimelate desuccinylase-like protein